MKGFDRAIARLSGGAQVACGLLGAVLSLLVVLAVFYWRSGQLIFSISTSVAIYFVIWWVTLFAVLPFRVRSQNEEGTVVAGSEPGAPASAPLLWYVLTTSAIATVLSVVFLVWIAPLI